jgi:hypothetical protein
MRGARRSIWFRLGLAPAFGAGLLPLLIALFHLAPASAMMMAGHHASEPHHHAATVEAAAADDAPAAIDEDCHPPGEPCDDHPLPSSIGEHCPLCLWLQGFHVLPAPVMPALRLPASRVIVVHRYDAPRGHSVVQTTSQPRAPPISPAV